jgi:hypothetical protein
VVEASRIPRRRGPLLGRQRERVQRQAVEAPAGRDELSGDALRDEPVRIPRGQPGPVEIGTGHRRPHGDVAHRLDPTGDHDVVRAREDPLGGEMDGLLRRATLPVDGGGRDPFGVAGGERRSAGDIGALLADRLTQPAITSSITRGSMPVRSTSAASGWASRSTGWTPARAPPGRPLPRGVRTASMMTASDITCAP